MNTAALERPLETLREDHPRLFLHNDALAELKARVESDESLQRVVRDVIARADNALDRPPLKHELRGPRLLHVSRDCLNRTFALALAYRWTNDTKYADAAIANLKTVCGFPDWNPSHFLDTAEMSAAVGIGYDWLYDVIDAPTRESIKDGLIRLGLEHGIDAYNGRGPSTWWMRSEHNWNQVCNGGLIVGALAIVETDPQYANEIIPQAVESFPLALKTYDPDGAWGEGPGYWTYATQYTTYGLDALQSALGTDFGLSDRDGLRHAAYAPVHTTGPTDLLLNYADSGERARRRPTGSMFWLARRYADAFIAAQEHAQIADKGASPEHLMWYVPKPDSDATAPLDKRFRGDVEVALFRSAWNDPNALFVGIKAGYNQVNHSHLDVGNFELDALGVRWARDLGADDYNLPGYWQSRRGGSRWQYYRLNAYSHNVPIIDGIDQDPEGVSKMTRFETGDDPFCVIDLSNAYADPVESLHRGLKLVDNRRGVLIQDELESSRPCEFAWGMTTDADISVASDGRSAMLTLDGKRLVASIVSPTDATFSVESAEQAPPQKTNEGVRRLVARVDVPATTLRFAVMLVPMPDGMTDLAPAELKPLIQW